MEKSWTSWNGEELNKTQLLQIFIHKTWVTKDFGDPLETNMFPFESMKDDKTRKQYSKFEFEQNVENIKILAQWRWMCLVKLN